MNKLVSIFIIFLSLPLKAAFVQLGTGGITPHFGSNKKNFCNQWNNTGIIVNKSYYIKMGIDPLAITYLRGNDSICSEIEGLFLHYTLKRYEYIDTELVFGGYSYIKENWDKHAEDTPGDIAPPELVHTDFGDKSVVPVLALGVHVHLIRRESWSIMLNNLLTPIIFNHSLAFEFRF